jgi:hypothetical protein
MHAYMPHWEELQRALRSLPTDLNSLQELDLSLS